MATAAAATALVPKEYGYVLLAASVTCVNAIWHGVRVGSFRRAAKVPYPIAFAYPKGDDYKEAATDPLAKEKYLFNCAQRAHSNFLEGLPPTVIAAAVVGLKYPTAAAALGVAWNAARVLYATGYTRADRERGSGRTLGSILSALLTVGLVGTSFKVSWDLISA